MWRDKAEESEECNCPPPLVKAAKFLQPGWVIIHVAGAEHLAVIGRDPDKGTTDTAGLLDAIADHFHGEITVYLAEDLWEEIKDHDKSQKPFDPRNN